MSELPKKVKFGYRVIEVNLDEQLHARRNLLNTAHTDLECVTVQSSLPEEVQKECLFRGLMSSITDTSGLAHSSLDKMRIATGVFAVIRDNPIMLESCDPETIRILGADWRIILENEHYEYVARYENCENALHLNRAYTSKKAWVAIWHEVLHVIWDKMGLEIGPEEDERDVDVLAFHLCTMFDQNDFSWLLEGNDE